MEIFVNIQDQIQREVGDIHFLLERLKVINRIANLPSLRIISTNNALTSQDIFKRTRSHQAKGRSS